jgi:hypothetical protein
VPEGVTREDPRDALERVLTEVNTEVVRFADNLLQTADDQGLSSEALIQRFKKDADLARAMIEGYVEWIGHTGADEGYRVTAPEQVITTPLPLGDDVFLTGKLDVRLRRDTDNVRLFMDHKTVPDLTRPVRMIHMNEQMLCYLLLESMQLDQEEPAGGALYNMLRKVKRTERATPPFYQRVEVRHNPSEVSAYATHLLSNVAHMLDAQRQLDGEGSHHVIAPPSPADDCAWSCDFVAVCPMLDDGSRAEDMILQLYTEVKHLDYYDKP